MKAQPAKPGTQTLGAHLADQLAELLAEALVADLKEFPNLGENKAEEETSVSSPTGYDRTGPRDETVASEANGCTHPTPGPPPTERGPD